MAVSQVPIQQDTGGHAEDTGHFKIFNIAFREKVLAIKIKAANGFSISLLLGKWREGELNTGR